MRHLITLGLPSALFALLFASPALALFNSKPVTEVTETQTYQYDVVVSGKLGDNIELTLLEGPKDMVLNNVNSLLWQTTYDDAGVYPVVLQAFDGHNTHQQAFELTVHNKNQPPVILSVPKTTIKETELFSYTVKASDPDGDSLRIEFLDAPEAMQTDGTHLQWQTDYQSAGNYPIHIRVHDGALYTDQSFVLTVENVNRPPVFSAVDASLLHTKEDTQWQLTIDVSDPDGDKVALSLANAPQGMTLINRSLHWRPTFQQAGDYQVQVIADDGQDRSTLSLPIHVENVNRLPAFTSEPVTQITESELYSYEVRAYDPDETPLRYRLLEAPEGMVIKGISQLHWQTGYDDAGSYPITIEVSDGEAAIEQSFTLQVANKNRPVEILSTPPTKIYEAEVFNYTFEAIDPDGEDIKIEYLRLPEQVKRDGNVLHWQTDFKSAGKYPFLIRASDAESTTEQAFVLEVINVNHKPVIHSKPKLKAIEAVAYEYRIDASDADDEPLSFTLNTAPEGMRIHNNLITWMPNFDQAGEHAVVLTVSDGIDTVKQSFTIAVANTNREPTLVDIDDQTIYAGETFRQQLEAGDVDGDDVKIHIIRAPSATKLNRHDVLSWRTREKDIGEHIFILEASDGDLKVREHFRLNVIERPTDSD